MDCTKVGRLIYRLRRERNLTQRQLAETIGVSDKAVSKWERGLGCPDVSLLRGLSKQLGIQLETLLQGELDPNGKDGGNMKRTKFYVCPTCGDLLTATQEADVSCCGRKLTPLTPTPADEAHRMHLELVEEDFYLTFPHEMHKDHFIRFVAYVSDSRMMLIRLYPEQGSEVRFPQMRNGKLYFCCSRHGLFVQTLEK